LSNDAVWSTFKAESKLISETEYCAWETEGDGTGELNEQLLEVSLHMDDLCSDEPLVLQIQKNNHLRSTSTYYA